MGKNSAFVFIKPHALTNDVQTAVKAEFAKRGITIVSEGRIEGSEIDKRQLIDNHYYAIAAKATLLEPKDIPVPADKFKAKFGLEWQAALDQGIAYNAAGAMEKLETDADGMDKLWQGAKKAGTLVKFGGGFYCAELDCKGKKIYAFNGFFMSMRSKFVAPGVAIYYYTVEWDSAKLSWADFRGKVLGPTDPKDAPADSLRGLILADWQKLGLKSEPNTGDNGVHASASPFEALAERMNWLDVDVKADEYGKRLLAAGISEATIAAWGKDPRVDVPSTEKASIFDSLEDMDSDECLCLAARVNSYATECPDSGAAAAGCPMSVCGLSPYCILGFAVAAAAGFGLAKFLEKK